MYYKNNFVLSILITVFVIFIFSVAIAKTDIDILVFFSPQDNCGAEILNRINSAKNSIDIAMYYFTSRHLAQALIDAKDRKVKVRVFLDGNQRTERFSKANYLTNKGINVKISNDTIGLMHNKFCVIDKKIVITGSFNWTSSADLRNNENLVMIESAETASAFTEQFEKLWNGRVPDQMRYKDENRLEKILQN